jgi:hypothetical protein
MKTPIDTKSVFLGLLLGVIVSIGIGAAAQNQSTPNPIKTNTTVDLRSTDGTFFKGKVTAVSGQWVKLYSTSREHTKGWINMEHVVHMDDHQQ